MPKGLKSSWRGGLAPSLCALVGWGLFRLYIYQFKFLDWIVLNGTLGQQRPVSKPVDDSGVVNVPQCLVRDTPDHQIAVQGTRQRVGGPLLGHIVSFMQKYGFENGSGIFSTRTFLHAGTYIIGDLEERRLRYPRSQSESVCNLGCWRLSVISKIEIETYLLYGRVGAWDDFGSWVCNIPVNTKSRAILRLNGLPCQGIRLLRSGNAYSQRSLAFAFYSLRALSRW